MLQEAVNARYEADYGIQYAEKAFSEKGKFHSRELALSFTEMQKGKMALGRFLLYSGSNNPYPHSMNVDNLVIEPRAEVIDPASLTVNPDFDQVTHIKFLRNGLNNLINKLIDMRMRPNGINNPKHSFMATQSLNDSLSYFECAFCFLGAELGRLRNENPGKYPSSGPIEEQKVSEETTTVNKTAAIMNERAGGTPASEVDPASRPYDGSDYLPGGRLYKKKDDL